MGEDVVRRLGGGRTGTAADAERFLFRGMVERGVEEGGMNGDVLLCCDGFIVHDKRQIHTVESLSDKK